jgi:hypothetical protein
MPRLKFDAGSLFSYMLRTIHHRSYNAVVLVNDLQRCVLRCLILN